MYLKGRIAVMLSIFSLISIDMFFIRCSNNNVAGTSVVGNPQVSAIITNENGIPQKHLTVALAPFNYNAVKQNDSVLIQGITDTSGHVVLKLGSDSAYNLISTDSATRCNLLKKVTYSDTINSSNHESIELGNVQFQKPGVIVVTIDSASFKSGNSIGIAGTLIKIEVTKPGTYNLTAPSGVVSVNYCAATKDSLSTAKDKIIDSVKVTSSDTVKVTTSELITPLYPDTIWIPVTYFDFHSNGTNPEFEQLHFSGTVKNMVADSLDDDGLPVLGSYINSNRYIEYWFRDWSLPNKGAKAKAKNTIPIYNYTGRTKNNDGDSAVFTSLRDTTYDTAFKNIVIQDSLPFTRVSGDNAMYQFIDNTFFPLDGKGFGNEGKTHNYSFTMEMSYSAQRSTNGSMIITGDDDIWAFVNKKLALDLGGIHTPSSDSITFDDSMLNATSSGYDFKVFIAERHTTMSNLKIQVKLLP